MLRVVVPMALVAMLAAAQQPLPGQCFEEYECIFQTTSSNGITWGFNLQPVCEKCTCGHTCVVFLSFCRCGCDGC